MRRSAGHAETTRRVEGGDGKVVHRLQCVDLGGQSPKAKPKGQIQQEKPKKPPMREGEISTSVSVSNAGKAARVGRGNAEPAVGGGNQAHPRGGALDEARKGRWLRQRMSLRLLGYFVGPMSGVRRGIRVAWIG